MLIGNKDDFFIQSFCNRIIKKVQEYKVPIITCIVVGLLCYAFALSNKEYKSS